MNIAVKEFKEKFSDRLGNMLDSECANLSKYSNSFKKMIELVNQIETWKQSN